MTNHLSKYDKYTGVTRENCVIDLKRKLQSQQKVIVKATISQQLSLMASVFDSCSVIYVDVIVRYAYFLIGFLFL
jgi:hypothetical protein